MAMYLEKCSAKMVSALQSPMTNFFIAPEAIVSHFGLYRPLKSSEMAVFKMSSRTWLPRTAAKSPKVKMGFPAM